MRQHVNAMALVVGVLALSGMMLGGCAGSGGAAVEEEGVVHSATASETAALKETAPIGGTEVVLYVNGLGCPLCATNIDKVLEREDYTRSVSVDLGQGTVTLGLKPGETAPSPKELADLVHDSGFTLVKISTR